MRALMLTPDEGHLDRRIAQEAVSLSRRGWSVDIYPAVDPALDFEDGLPPEVRLLPGLGRRRAPTRGRVALRSARRVIARSIPSVDRTIESARYRRRDQAAAIASANVDHLLGVGPYELIFAHDVPVFPLAAALKRHWGVPLICDLHEVFPEQDEYFTSRRARAYWRRVEGSGLAAADGILCVNDAVADYARRTHAPAAALAVVHNSVPYLPPDALRGATLRDLYPMTERTKVMLFAGSLRPHKNLEALIEGFGRADLDGWALAILGEGPLRPALEAMVHRHRLAGRVFVGQHAAQRDLVAITASADMGVLPYQAVGYNYLVATPNKLFEYIQARLPIATSRLPMIERIVTANGNGGFVDFATPATTAKGLSEFVASTLDSVTSEALEAAAKRYSWESDEPALFSVVGQALSGPDR